ncbi:MAG: GNAT family N-acetyltransferase [Solirubrobacteraceae bacterium]
MQQKVVDGENLLGMCVVAAARGRGGGHALLDAAMAWLAGSDMHKVELEVWPDNGPAIALYARYGFEVEGLRRDHYRRKDGSLRSALIMARRLRP